MELVEGAAILAVAAMLGFVTLAGCALCGAGAGGAGDDDDAGPQEDAKAKPAPNPRKMLSQLSTMTVGRWIGAGRPGGGGVRRLSMKRTKPMTTTHARVPMTMAATAPPERPLPSPPPQPRPPPPL